MRAVVRGYERAPVLEAALLAGPLAAFTLALTMGYPLAPVAGAVALGTALLLWHRALLSWQGLVATLLLVILLIPIRRYRMPVELPFELEPYRVAVAVIAALWISSLLIDPRVRLRYSGFEAPLVLFGVGAIGSVFANGARIDALAVESKVMKELTFFASFILVLYLIVSVVRSTGAIDFLVRLLVSVTSVVALLAVVEARTGLNPFDHLDIIPLLQPDQQLDIATRGGRFRALGPSQHPIALGAAFVVVLPLAIYLGSTTKKRRWWLAVAALALGILAPFARTSVVMLLVVCLVFLWLRPKHTRRLWPAILPLLVVVHFALPGTIGSLKASFFPKGGLIADQSQSVGSRGQGRVADLGPTLTQWSERPLFGNGFGSRVVTGETPNAQILDNQWLATLLETGLAGAFALAWLFVRVIRRLAAAAKKDQSERGWLFVALAASIAAFGLGMLTYDAFSFIQVTFLFFIVLAFASVELTRAAERDADAVPAPTTRRF
jgi:hypothetical protein